MPTGLAALKRLGFGPPFDAAFAALGNIEWQPARVTAGFQGLYRVGYAGGERLTQISGTLRHEAQTAADLPAVGDWVAVTIPDGRDHGTLHAVLPRRSAFIRKAPGDDLKQQVVAANVDTVFLVMGLDADFNVRRIERYLTLAWESGAQPVIVLNKADLAEDPPARVAEVEAIAPAVPVLLIAAKGGVGIEALQTFLGPGHTVALLGSSGAGKSTLVNQLLGHERQRTHSVRASDQRGRHTTSHRELITLEGGGMVIDTPGMRELQLWDANPALRDTFGDLEGIAATCRFRDCGHGEEPGCAVRAAVEAGTFPADRLASYHKLHAELQALGNLQDKRAQSVQKGRVKVIHKAARSHKPRG